MSVDSSISFFFHFPFSNLNQKVAWFISFFLDIPSPLSFNHGGGYGKKEGNKKHKAS